LIHLASESVPTVELRAAIDATFRGEGPVQMKPVQARHTTAERGRGFLQFECYPYETDGSEGAITNVRID
jgi:hypothetical protein